MPPAAVGDNPPRTPLIGKVFRGLLAMVLEAKHCRKGLKRARSTATATPPPFTPCLQVGFQRAVTPFARRCNGVFSHVQALVFPDPQPTGLPISPKESLKQLFPVGGPGASGPRPPEALFPLLPSSPYSPPGAVRPGRMAVPWAWIGRSARTARVGPCSRPGRRPKTRRASRAKRSTGWWLM